MNRMEAIKTLQQMAASIAYNMGYTEMYIGEERQKGIWGENFTKFLEEKYGECTKTIKWFKPEFPVDMSYGNNIEFSFRFSNPQICIDNRVLDGSLANVEFSDFNTKLFHEYKNEKDTKEEELGRFLTNEEDLLLQKKYPYLTGDFKPREYQVFEGDNGLGMKLLNILLGEWNTVCKKNEDCLKLYDIALLEIPLDEGLDHNDIEKLWNKLKPEHNGHVYAVPLEIEGSNSTACGFIRQGVADSEIDFEDKIKEILMDMDKETPSGIYQFGNISVFLSRDLDSDINFMQTNADTEGNFKKDCLGSDDSDNIGQTVASKGLQGYIWLHYEDGSGSLEDPDGSTVLQYDLVTRKYKLLIGSHKGWRNIPDGFLLGKFKVFAEDECKLIIEKEAEKTFI